MVRNKLPVATVILASVVLTACSDRAATAPPRTIDAPAVVSQSQTGSLHMIADCSQYTGLAGSFCTIVASNLVEGGAGSRAVYASAAGVTSGLSDVALDPPGPGNNAAFGHCSPGPATSLNQCTFSNGTGNLTGFRANVVVTHAGGDIYYWDGTYSFTP
jgi:hypothetical protein